MLLGVEAAGLGRGGSKVLAAATGVHPDTVARGVREIEGISELQSRVRAAAGGRKPLAQTDPEIAAELKLLVDPGTRGDPVSPLVWTTKSTRTLRDVGRGHESRSEYAGRVGCLCQTEMLFSRLGRYPRMLPITAVRPTSRTMAAPTAVPGMNPSDTVVLQALGCKTGRPRQIDSLKRQALSFSEVVYTNSSSQKEQLTGRSCGCGGTERRRRQDLGRKRNWRNPKPAPEPCRWKAKAQLSAAAANPSLFPP